jgi:hypothetical protein
MVDLPQISLSVNLGLSEVYGLLGAAVAVFLWRAGSFFSLLAQHGGRATLLKSRYALPDVQRAARRLWLATAASIVALVVFSWFFGEIIHFLQHANLLIDELDPMRASKYDLSAVHRATLHLAAVRNRGIILSLVLIVLLFLEWLIASGVRSGDLTEARLPAEEHPYAIPTGGDHKARWADRVFRLRDAIHEDLRNTREAQVLGALRADDWRHSWAAWVASVNGYRRMYVAMESRRETR